MAQDQGRQDKLLPGESSSMSSGEAEDAVHWIEVYSELAGFKDTLLSQVAEQRQKVTDDGQAEVEADENLLRPESERLHRRLEFWRGELDRRGG